MTVGSHRLSELQVQLSQHTHMPFYVMEWKMRAGCPKKAFECFLSTGAPFPGVKGEPCPLLARTAPSPRSS